MRRWLSLAILPLLACRAHAAADVAVVDQANGEVRIAATVQPKAMSRPFGGEGHHAIVWEGGRAKRWALFVSKVSDHDVRAALDAVGAKAGENLTEDSWNARSDPHSVEPDKRVEGTSVAVFVEWNGSGRVPLAQLIAEKGRPMPLLDFRYGGNERFQKDFHSGCIVCLYSCPGGAIGNHAHPIRDYVHQGVIYSSIVQKLPPAGTKVILILKLMKEST